MSNIHEIEKRLSDFDVKKRRKALNDIINFSSAKEYPRNDKVNMHFHSFFSYNSEGWSPTRIAWESKKAGLFAAGLVDFDVIDGMEEFIGACDSLGVRASVGVESRTFFAKFADAEMDSPGEPGVDYVMGVGFSEKFDPASQQAVKLEQYRKGAGERNKSLISRINSKVADIAIDYEKEVIPLTPSGNATERHIVSAYINKSFQVFGSDQKAFEYMSGVLGKSPSELSEIFHKSRPAYDELVRAKFAKKGGLGYVQPSQDTFPPMKEFLSWVKSAGAIPTEAWLDGTTKGESLGIKYLEASKAEGSEALNIIPDRNWNIKDAETKKVKVDRLAEVIAAAEKLGMPVFIGTEMNKSGQPFADDIDNEVLSPFKKIFLKGAKIAVGHSILARFAKFHYSGAEAAAEFKSISEKNIFFSEVGNLAPMNQEQLLKISGLRPKEAFAKIADSAKAETWKI
ncbi:MAG TPA: hypothetical protein PK821_03065 [Victivallales bacterium]|nr:hypothetical protein [Victivallales bacterium]